MTICYTCVISLAPDRLFAQCERVQYRVLENVLSGSEISSKTPGILSTVSSTNPAITIAVFTRDTFT